MNCFTDWAALRRWLRWLKQQDATRSSSGVVTK
jgi:hypothetical protein